MPYRVAVDIDIRYQLICGHGEYTDALINSERILYAAHLPSMR